MKKAIGAIIIALILTGCDKPKIDTSTDESMKTSIHKVRESLPEEKRASFDEALKVVAFSQLSMKDLMQAGMADDPSLVEGKLKESLSGKTADDVISYASTIMKERAEKEKEQAKQEIAELEQKKTDSLKSLSQLKAFEVKKSRFYFEKKEYGRDQPIISLSVTNRTNKAVSRAYFKGVIASPGREVPWYTDTFNYQIPGGLEPGESADWRLAPNTFSDWGDVNAPEDAIFTVTVVRIDDAQGNSIYGDSEFTERDAIRLAELKEKFPTAAH